MGTKMWKNKEIHRWILRTYAKMNEQTVKVHDVYYTSKYKSCAGLSKIKSIKHLEWERTQKKTIHWYLSIYRRQQSDVCNEYETDKSKKKKKCVSVEVECTSIRNATQEIMSIFSLAFKNHLSAHAQTPTQTLTENQSIESFTFCFHLFHLKTKTKTLQHCFRTQIFAHIPFFLCKREFAWIGRKNAFIFIWFIYFFWVEWTYELKRHKNQLQRNRNANFFYIRTRKLSKMPKTEQKKQSLALNTLSVFVYKIPRKKNNERKAKRNEMKNKHWQWISFSNVCARV